MEEFKFDSYEVYGYDVSDVVDVKFCPYDIARLLLDAEIRIFTSWYVNPDNDICNTDSEKWCKVYPDNGCEYYVPTYPISGIVNWLHIEHGIYVMPTIGCDLDREPRVFYRVVIAEIKEDGSITYHDPLDENGYDIPLDATMDGIRWSLKELILKQNNDMTSNMTPKVALEDLRDDFAEKHVHDVWNDPTVAQSVLTTTDFIAGWDKCLETIAPRIEDFICKRQAEDLTVTDVTNFIQDLKKEVLQ